MALHAMPMAARVPPAELFDVLSRLQVTPMPYAARVGTLWQGHSSAAWNLFNHSCAPNVCFDSVPVPFTAEMTAVAGDADAAYSGSASSSAFCPPPSLPPSLPRPARLPLPLRSAL